MENYNEVIRLAEGLIEEHGSKQSKASNKRRRTLMTAMKKVITDAKKELIAMDKGE